MSIITESKATRRLTVLLVMIIGVAMIIPSNLAFASPDDGSSDEGTTEDDGWVEGDDDSQGEISSQEELEEAYEGSQWEDNIGSNEFEVATDNDDENDDELVKCEDESLVETEELCEQSETLVTCSDGSSAATQAECPLEPVSSFATCPDGSSAATQAECPPAPDPCFENPDLLECGLPVICPDGGDPLPDGSCPPVICPDGGDPLPDGSCPPPPIKCGKGTQLENGKCVIKDNGGGSSSSSSSSSSSASATANVIGAEVSSCRLDGNAHGMQQKFDSIKYRACGLYPNGQIAYTDGFVMGCNKSVIPNNSVKRS